MCSYMNRHSSVSIVTGYELGVQGSNSGRVNMRLLVTVLRSLLGSTWYAIELVMKLKLLEPEADHSHIPSAYPLDVELKRGIIYLSPFCPESFLRLQLRLRSVFGQSQ
jgi:hypothetical protein